MGRVVCGVELPVFNKMIKNYLTPEGDEIDLFARNDESWAFELKWKNKRAGVKELKKFLNKINVKHHVYISRKGFTKGAFELAENSGVTLWEGEDLLKGR